MLIFIDFLKRISVNTYYQLCKVRAARDKKSRPEVRPAKAKVSNPGTVLAWAMIGETVAGFFSLLWNILALTERGEGGGALSGVHLGIIILEMPMIPPLLVIFFYRRLPVAPRQPLTMASCLMYIYATNIDPDYDEAIRVANEMMEAQKNPEQSPDVASSPLPTTSSGDSPKIEMDTSDPIMAQNMLQSIGFVSKVRAPILSEPPAFQPPSSTANSNDSLEKSDKKSPVTITELASEPITSFFSTNKPKKPVKSKIDYTDPRSIIRHRNIYEQMFVENVQCAYGKFLLMGGTFWDM